MNWFIIKNMETTDSPALVIYKQRVVENIRKLKSMVSNVGNLRPHVKTNKISEVCSLMMDAGIQKFKCATIAEAEMLAMIKAPDVLLAYQPVGPKISRFADLVKTYPGTAFSCLTDNASTATQLSNEFVKHGLIASVFIDLNTGMNRTGIQPGKKAWSLVETCVDLPGIKVAGLHAYDGHILDKDFHIRKQHSDASFEPVRSLAQQIFTSYGWECPIVAGGSPGFPVHAQRPGVECSPGTFVFWDWGYRHSFPDEPFEYAALVITRIISVIGPETVCTDLGHKAVAAENPLPRVHFLNAPLAKPISQSEEHLVLKLPLGHGFNLGDVLYGVPVHICPTVALYDTALVVEEGQITGSWKVVARNRSITI